MKTLLIYDLDGTLVDTREDITAAANHMREQMGKSPLSVQEVSQYVGRGLHALLRGCLETDDPKIIEKGSKNVKDVIGIIRKKLERVRAEAQK